MKFLLDQSVDARLVPWLTNRGHDAVRIGRDYPPGLPDFEVLAIAVREQRVLITDDRDFGELVFRHRKPHTGQGRRIKDFCPIYKSRRQI